MHRSEQGPSMVMNEQPQGFNPDAFDSLVRNYETRLMRVALRITGQREDAEDVVQETFLRVYEKMGQFEGKSQFSSWVTRITINQALTCLRNRGRAKEKRVSARARHLGDRIAQNFSALKASEAYISPKISPLRRSQGAWE